MFLFSTGGQACSPRTAVCFNLIKTVMLISDLASFFLTTAPKLRTKSEIISECAGLHTTWIVCVHLIPRHIFVTLSKFCLPRLFYCFFSTLNKRAKKKKLNKKHNVSASWWRWVWGFNSEPSKGQASSVSSSCPCGTAIQPTIFISLSIF